VEALGRALACGLQLLEGFEERLDARLTQIDANWDAPLVQQDSQRLEKIVERFVKEGSGKSASAVNTIN